MILGENTGSAGQTFTAPSVYRYDQAAQNAMAPTVPAGLNPIFSRIFGEATQAVRAAVGHGSEVPASTQPAPTRGGFMGTGIPLPVVLIGAYLLLR